METVLVCVTVQKECERLILAGRRFAEAEGLPLRELLDDRITVMKA